MSVFNFNAADGLITPARFVRSPNCDARPDGTLINVLVIHAISLPPRSYGGDHIEKFFLNQLHHDAHPYFAGLRGVKVSAHFLVKRDGELLQFVPTRMRAWHAGESEFRGRAAVNDFSIGVELEGCDDDSFTPAQYDTLAGLAHTLIKAYPIRAEHIVGHSDIAPGRKTDPGPGFDWQRLRRDINTVA